MKKLVRNAVPGVLLIVALLIPAMVQAAGPPPLPQNNGAPDLIVRATRGADFGFPEGNWLSDVPARA